ncbi:MAG: site-2 protease family protein [Clostridiales bacterium]|jgi:Zn-dependent protease|nr:site-2 protease family protein [Clostridiales bacterium]
MFNASSFNVTELIARLIAIIIAFSVHEFSHGLASYILGDPTAKTDGRLSLNPMRHIDPVGFICLLVLRIGWAKPVNVDPRYYDNPKWGMAITALAGPASNFLMAAAAIFIFFPISVFFGDSPSMQFPNLLFVEFLGINISLMIFNMIPIPPLDGSKVFFAVFPDNMYFNMISTTNISNIIFVVILFTGVASRIIGPVQSFFINGLFGLAELFYGLIFNVVYML